MSTIKGGDWELWHQERQAFAKRETKDIIEDLEALKAHILMLQNVCPKDSAGRPVGKALGYLDKLRKDHERFTRYLEQLR